MAGFQRPFATDFLNPANVLQYVYADEHTMDLTGSNIDTWYDQSGNSWDYAKTDDARRLVFSASGGPNNRAYVSQDTNAKRMKSLLKLTIPSSVPIVVWIVGRNVGYTATGGARLLIHSSLDGGTSAHQIIQSATVNGRLQMANSALANTNNGFPDSTWGRIQAYFSNSTGDYLECLGTKVTGQNSGNAGWPPHLDTWIGSGEGGLSTGMSFDWLELLYHIGDFSPTEKTALDLYLTRWYGIPVP